jgi:hypothetical protein
MAGWYLEWSGVESEFILELPPGPRGEWLVTEAISRNEKYRAIFAFFSWLACFQRFFKAERVLGQK